MRLSASIVYVYGPRFAASRKRTSIRTLPSSLGVTKRALAIVTVDNHVNALIGAAGGMVRSGIGTPLVPRRADRHVLMSVRLNNQRRRVPRSGSSVVPTPAQHA